MSEVLYEVREYVAVISLDNPPVNSLGLALRSAIIESFRNAVADDAIKGIVITSRGKLFSGGADIVEFASGAFTTRPDLGSILDEIEASPKIVVAAINGAALGGGFELALACDYRFALPTSSVGLPEVSLGLIPGAGGTQRLPRFSGPKLALEMITSGQPVPAPQLLAAGAVDKIHADADDFVDAAVAYTRELIADGKPLRNCASIAVDTSGLSASFFDEFKQSIAKSSRGYFAPAKCVEAVQAACVLPFAEGLKKEKALFEECSNTPQARALQHLFFAERAANKIPGVDAKTTPRTIKKVAVIGSGTMGGGIAMNFLNSGIETVILDLNAQALERGIGAIRTNYEITAKKGKLSEADLQKRLALLQSTTDYSAIADVDLVIEAVFEKMEIKKAVFKKLDEVCKPGAILATNTSTLNVDEIAAVTKRPQDVIGTHFFSPANVMRLLELVRATQTADDVIVTMIKTAQKIRKIPVVVGLCFGFVGNRMVEPYGRESARLVLEGATPAEVDGALTDFGMAMGYPSMIDLAGIDVGELTREANQAAIAHDASYAIVSKKLYEKGDFGQKTGRGYYLYEGRKKTENPEVIELAKELAGELGVQQRKISSDEIRERALFTMINEGAQILDEGIAYRSSDVDLIFVNGYGFPAWRGGPMQYADEIGLDKVLEALNRYRSELGAYGEMWFRPAPLLERLVKEGKKFSDLD